MNQKSHRPTLQDVAERVGVTKMTVSRYMRDPSLVSQASQEKIARALDELGYIPNRAPELLSNAKSRAIGVLLPSLTNQVFAEVLRGLEAVTEPAGYQTMLAHYGYSQQVEEERIASLLSYHVDGLILSENVHSERTIRMIQMADIPVVEIMDSVSPCMMQSVGFDNAQASYAMTRLMIERGYHHIVYLAARMDVRTKLKMDGYTRAMQDQHLAPRSVVTDRPSSFSLGGELLRDAQLRYPDVDGVFCTNDDLAVGAVFECQRQRLAVPRQMAVAGFHGHDIGQAMVPKLASVMTPRYIMGQRAAQELLDRLQGKPMTQPVVDVGFELSAGESL